MVKARARNKRTINIKNVPLLAPDTPNLHLERQDDAAKALRFNLVIKLVSIFYVVNAK